MIYISTGGERGEAADETARRFLDHGIEGIELSGGRPHDGLIPGLKALADRARFQVHNYFPPPSRPFVLNLASLDEEVASASHEHVQRAVRLAAELDCHRYGFHAGFLIDPRVAELGAKIDRRPLFPRTQAFAAFVERLQALAEHARGEGVELLIENNVLSPRNFREFGENPLLMVEADEIEQVLRQMPGNVGLLLDVAHLKVSASTLGFDPAPVLQRLRPLIRGYHLSDNDGTADSNDAVTDASWFWPHMRTDLDYYTLEVYRRSPAELLALAQLTARKLGRPAHTVARQ